MRKTVRVSKRNRERAMEKERRDLRKGEMGTSAKEERVSKGKSQERVSHIWSPSSDVRPRTSEMNVGGSFSRYGVQHYDDGGG
jgi:hypothetical protein